MSKDDLPRHKLDDGITTVHLIRYRPPHPSAPKINPVWHATYKFEGEPRVGPKSLKTRNLQDALNLAAQEARKLTYLRSEGQSIRPNSFREVAGGFLRYYKHECQRDDKIEAYKHAKLVLEDRAVPFFENKIISRIQPEDIIRYRDWRIRTGHRGKPFAKSTISKELMVIRKVFYFARARGIVNDIPSIKGDKIENNFTTRPAMPYEEWEALDAYLETWHEELEPYQKPQRFYREALRDWCRVIAYSGLRTGEASLLKWKDWTVIKDSGGNEKCRLYVRADEKRARKTGERPVIASHELNEVLEKRKASVSLTGPENYIFSHENRHEGKPIMKFNKTFKQALENCGLLYDEKGNERAGYTPYILRHSRATWDLIDNPNLLMVALNLGNETKTTEKFYSKASADDYVDHLGNNRVNQKSKN